MDRQLRHKESDFIRRNFKVKLLCDSVSGPANIGAIYRVCDAFGVEKVIFNNVIPDLTSGRLKKTSRNTFSTVSFEVVEDAVKTLQDLKKSGYTVIGLEVTARSKKLQDFQEKDLYGIVLVIGAENQGISENVLSCCDSILHIPMYGENSSMNVAQATSIALYHLTNLLL